MKTKNNKMTLSSEQFKWINEPEKWHVSDGMVEITAESGVDFFLDPAGYHVAMTAPLFYFDTEEDFVATVHIGLTMNHEFDSGCLMVMSDDKNWAKICFEYVSLEPYIVSVVTKGTSDDSNATAIPQDTTYLRITRKGDCYAFHYSMDGIEWILVRYFDLPGSKTMKLGMVAQCPTGDTCTVTFRHFDYQVKRVDNLRISV